ncbi:MAG: acetylornithine/succinylornithine family transaminase [Puniceicoccales bacterium]|jgi:acetylornithine aminotransferase/acetylornithine/N-succinyldiaminopimelate aminotransferase|nr:acetylornithine/succinylornithine family transaminase [Puniceicoccales bacterium]
MNDTAGAALTPAQQAPCLLGNYAPPALTLARGEGAYVWDDAGRRYLDFCMGIACNSLGHAHPHWVAAIQRQAGLLAQTSNLFSHGLQERLAQAINARVNANDDNPNATNGQTGRMFFCNSGTEANEALLKLARLHGLRKSGGKEGVAIRVVVAAKAFHGRTFGAMAATPQEKIQNGYRPMLDGFFAGELNNLESFERLVGEHTAAVLIEAVQGEGGLSTATPAFLQGLRKLCDKHNALLLFDEIQCGMGRTGKFLAFQHCDVTADAFSLAKGIAGGFPMGAIWVAPQHADLFTPGSHGTTFGGNPLACAAALAVQEVFTQENLVHKVATRSNTWHAQLHTLAQKYPATIKSVRGVGYLAGLALHTETPPLIAAIRQRGLLATPAGDNVIRLLPPLTATPGELQECVAILDKTLAA